MTSKNSKLGDPRVEPPAIESKGARTIPVSGHRLESIDLFAGTREITIGHAGEVYRLRLTAQNKLILTK